MEESKDLITGYKIFRSLIYISVIVEFFMYAVDPQMLDFWGGIVCDIHSRMKRWFIYNDGNLIWSKVATLLLICITCIGTRNKKQLEFDARRQVLYPLVGGIFTVVLSVWLFGHRMDVRIYTIALNRWLYMMTTVTGTVLIHVALDNISKFLKEGLLKDRFNFENESFVQCEEKIENRYSVNIPMRYYYKGKFGNLQFFVFQVFTELRFAGETKWKQIWRKLFFVFLRVQRYAFSLNFPSVSPTINAKLTKYADDKFHLPVSVNSTCYHIE